MTSEHELAAKLARIAQSEATDVIRPVAQLLGTDTVLSVSGDRCSLTSAGPNFRVVGGLTVISGDLVLFARQGTDRHVVAVIGRNAMDGGGGGSGDGFANPMTAAGDIIIGSTDGAPVALPAGADTEVLTLAAGVPEWAAPTGGGAPTTADYLVGTAQAGLSAEIPVGTTPGGELGGTWASPTVDSSHSGSTHAATQAAAEATASTALGVHAAASDPHPGYTTAAELSAFAQPLDSDLTAIAGLTPTNDDIVQRKAGAWANRTIAQLLTDLGLGALYQPLDSDLTAIAALSTTSYGRSLLAAADAAALRTLAASVIGTDVEAHDADLTAIAGLSPANDDVIQRKAGAWANRTIAQLLTDLGLAALYQPLDSDLTAIAAIAPTNDDLIQRKAGAWANRTMTQLMADLGALGQIPFPAAQSAAAGANVLDDYEEGTFTPALAYATVGSSSWAINFQLGWYTKIGNVVTYTLFYSGVPTNGSGAGTLSLSGMPFTAKATTNEHHANACQMQGYTKANYTQITLQVRQNTTTCEFHASGSGQADAALAVGDIPTGGTVIVRSSGVYFTAT